MAAIGRAAFREVAENSRQEDPFAFVDQSTAVPTAGIDTTPTTPNPPSNLVEAATRAIPVILANVRPNHSGAIELVASELVKRLQDSNHSLAAAQWAVHGAIQAGYLKAGRIEVNLPSIGRQVGRTAMFRLPDTRGMEFSGGGKSTVAIPQGKRAPFDSFKVNATESLWHWWRLPDAVAEAGRLPRDAVSVSANARTETGPPLPASQPEPACPLADAESARAASDSPPRANTSPGHEWLSDEEFEAWAMYHPGPAVRVRKVRKRHELMASAVSHGKTTPEEVFQFVKAIDPKLVMESGNELNARRMWKLFQQDLRYKTDANG